MALPEYMMEKYDFSSLRKQFRDASSDMREYGGAGNNSLWSSVINEDYNPALRGANAIAIYDKMRRSDAQVRGILKAVKAPLLSANWFMQPASEDERDLKVARFVEWNMHEMSRTWIQFLAEALLCMDFGYYLFEKVYDVGVWRDDKARAKPMNVIKWKKFAPRHPLTVERWAFDTHGGLEGVYQTQSSGASVFIPIEKLLLFTYDEEANNPEGISILRSVYKHFYYKDQFYKIDGIQKERHGIGVPHIELPIGYSTDDKTYAAELGRNLRTNDKAYIVTPPGWIVKFAELRNQPVSALESAEHHDALMARTVLAQFLNVGVSEVGARSSVSASQDMFVKSLRYIADMLAAVINQFAIPQLVDFNFDVERYPRLKTRKLGDTTDVRAFSVALRNLADAALITPSPELERWISEEFEMPMPSKEAQARTIEQRTEQPGSNTNPPHE